MSVTANDIRAAETTLQGQVIRTPILAAPLLSRQFGCDLYLKLECQQYTSSFKARGAYIAMHSLSSAQRNAGVIAMSAGNHAQAVAYHAERMGLPAVIVMPAPGLGRRAPGTTPPTHALPCSGLACVATCHAG